MVVDMVVNINIGASRLTMAVRKDYPAFCQTFSLSLTSVTVVTLTAAKQLLFFYI